MTNTGPRNLGDHAQSASSLLFRLERKGDRIDERLDRRAERVERRHDRRTGVADAAKVAPELSD